MAEGYTIGQAYIQVLPETEKFGSTLKGEAEKSGEDAGTSASSGFSKGFGTAAKVAGAAVAAAATGIAALTTSAVNAYADYEQLVGGIETLYGDSADQMVAYANEAYKTAGLSANDYMETATSFAASLVSSLQGDTEQAAEYANMAITDMSDNANKMGTDMTSIQNAYQGFAKQNYTMLDNLKLGYGGTKSEMERLIADANALKEAQGEVGDLTIDSYADIVEAIHLVQTEMGITGTTSQEAATTISGSINTMKGAWDNWLVGLANGNADVTQLTNDLIDSFVGVVDNIEPVVQQILQALPNAIDAIVAEIPSLVGDFTSILPGLIQAAVNLVTNLAANVGTIVSPIIQALPSVIESILTGLTTCLPQILSGLGTLAGQLIAELPSLLGTIVTSIPDLLYGIGSGLAEGVANMITEVFASEDYKAAIAAMEAEIDNVINKNDQLSASLNNNKTSYENTVVATEANASAAEVLWGKIQSLVGQEELDAGQKEIVAGLVEQLNQLVPDLALNYDKETGSLSLTNEQILAHIENMKLEAQQAAAMDFYTEALKAQYEAELNLSNATKTAADLLNRYGVESTDVGAVVQALGGDWNTAWSLLQKYNISISDAWELFQMGPDVVQGVVDAVKNKKDADEQAAWAEELVAEKTQEVIDAQEEAMQTAQDVVESTGDVVEAAEEVASATADTAEAVSEASSDMSEATKQTATDVTENMSEVQTAIDSVDPSGAVADMEQAGVDMVNATDNEAEIGANTAEGMNAMISEIEGKMASLSTAFSGIVLKASEKLGVQSQFQANLKVYGGKVPTLMAEGSNNNIGLFESAMQSVISAAESIISPIINSMQNAGQMAGQGLGDGLYSMWNYVYNAASSLANAARQGAYITLQIHSPSKVFREIGQFTSEGMALGIEDNADMVTDAMDTITTDIKDGASQIAEDINDTTLGVLGGSVDYSSEVKSTISGSIDANVTNNSKSDTVISYLKAVAERIDKLSKMQLVTDTGVLAGQLAPAINSEFATMATMEARR